jgi:hypothetical protein
MMPDAGRAARQRLYDKHVELIKLLIEDSEKHLSRHPDCPAAPVCIGGSTISSLRDMVKEGEILTGDLVVVLVNELAQERKRTESLAARLEAQRQTTESLFPLVRWENI